MPRKSSTAAGSAASPPHALPLPQELITQVFIHLERTHRPTLAACCTVSKAFFALAAPLLYRQIIISPNDQRDSRADHDPKHINPTTFRINPHTRKRKLLLNAEIVALDYHSNVGCERGLRFPKLHTLHIRSLICGMGPVLHWDPATLSEKQCLMAKALLPKRLVISGASLLHIQQFPTGFPYKLYEEVEHLIFVCPSDPFRPNGCRQGFTVPKLRKVVWILHTSQPGAPWSPGSQDIWGRHPRDSDVTNEIWTLAAVIVSLPDVPVLLINTGAVGLKPLLVPSSAPARNNSTTISTASEAPALASLASDPTTPSVADGTSTGTSLAAQYAANQLRFAEQLRPYLLMEAESNAHRHNDSAVGALDVKDDPQAIADRKFDLIQFLTMEEYLALEDWEGVFERKQMGAWLGEEKVAHDVTALTNTTTDTCNKNRIGAKGGTANETALKNEDEDGESKV